MPSSTTSTSSERDELHRTSARRAPAGGPRCSRPPGRLRTPLPAPGREVAERRHAGRTRTRPPRRPAAAGARAPPRPDRGRAPVRGPAGRRPPTSPEAGRSCPAISPSPLMTSSPWSGVEPLDGEAGAHQERAQTVVQVAPQPLALEAGGRAVWSAAARSASRRRTACAAANLVRQLAQQHRVRPAEGHPGVAERDDEGPEQLRLVHQGELHDVLSRSCARHPVGKQHETDRPCADQPRDRVGDRGPQGCVVRGGLQSPAQDVRRDRRPVRLPKTAGLPAAAAARGLGRRRDERQPAVRPAPDELVRRRRRPPGRPRRWPGSDRRTPRSAE